MTYSPITAHLSGVTLRAYTRADLDAMFHLDEVCFREPFRFSRADIRRFSESRKAEVLLATEGAQLAGFSIVHMERGAGVKVGYLLTLDVALGFRRRGLARWLMDNAERAAREKGCVAMLLHVFTGNAAAIGLYEKLSYVRAGVAEHFYGKDMHAWEYRKALR